MSFFTPFPALCRQACDVASAACLAMILCSQVVAAERAPAESAAAIYNEKCAYCHGEQGQGVPGIFDGALYGEQSVADLARFIDRTMPDDDPEACVDDEAQQVAAYIYDAFYSPAARIEHGLVAPPRIELLRLTAAQYQNTVADLIGYFTPAARRGRKRAADQASSEPGLRAEYFQSDGMNKADERRLDRVDRRIDFRFGEESPAENITADQFAIIWNGSIFAPDSGHYDFRVSTENGVRLYLNVDRRGRDGKLRDDSANVRQKALIDAWVSSGKKREESKRVYLLGGRRYPLRLEFFKYKEPTASIKLEWKTPHGVWSVIDGTYLSTERAPRTWVVDTPLPADDRSLGYERGSSISQQWHTP